MCKIRKCGTLLYRSNGDILLALTNALYASTRRACSERDGTNTAHCDSEGVNEATHVKTVRRFFCLCALMFCTNDRCSMPLHNLITDLVDGLGGSVLLVKMLNRLGVCSSADTLARAIQYQVTERENRGVQSECSSTAFSIDNIDFLHSYARVFCGDQKRSWHGTIIQLVQPQPKYLHELTQSPQSNNHTIRSNDGVSRQLQDSHMHLNRRRKRDVNRPYASPSSKSPVPET